MTDYDAQEAAILERRKRYAQQLQQGAPRGQMAGRVFVGANPLEYLAAGLRGVGAMQGEQQAEQELGTLRQQRGEASQKALAEFLRQSQGTPENAPVDGMGPVLPAQPANMQGAYAALMQAPDASMRQMGMQGMVNMPKVQAEQAARAEDRAFRTQEAQLARDARMQELQQNIAARQEQAAMVHQQRMDAMAAQNASREQMAQAQREFQQQMQVDRIEAQKTMKSLAGSVASAQPYYQPVQTAQGVFAFNARTGKVEPVMGQNGQPIVGAGADPALQGSIAGAKAGATTEAKARTEARIDAPKVIQQGEDTIRLVDDLLKAPGFKQAVGASRLLGVQKVPGTAAKDFDVRLDQLKGQQFLQAFETLKGGGQITEVEGKKATDAIARMDAAGSEAEFTKAAKEFQDVIRVGVGRAKAAQGAQPAQPAAAPKRIRLDAQGNVIP